jgi:DNA-binding transcriptional regulator YiaG
MAFTEYTPEEVERLKAYREALGLPRSAIIPHIGCSLSSFYRWESGKSTPSPAFRSKIRAVNQALEEAQK